MTQNQEHQIAITQQARYYTLGALGPHTKAIWIVCHGYGQLAPYFIRHFEVLAQAGHFVIAPEGLSRFYLQGTSGRVGASWMTREDRQTDISNYVSYITSIYDSLLQGQSAPLNLFGFSQGVATICRWAMLSGKPFEELVLWAGVFPPDLPPELSASTLKNRKVSVVWGENDPYLSATDRKQHLKAFEECGVEPQLITFQGKHELNAEVLKTYFADRGAAATSSAS
jgi:dienelactone hydrolase